MLRKEYTTVYWIPTYNLSKEQGLSNVYSSGYRKDFPESHKMEKATDLILFVAPGNSS